MAMWTTWSVNCYRETSGGCAHVYNTGLRGKRTAKEWLKEQGWHCAGGPGDNPYWICPACQKEMRDE